jgi:hypothetical protein
MLPGARRKYNESSVWWSTLSEEAKIEAFGIDEHHKLALGIIIFTDPTDEYDEILWTSQAVDEAIDLE